REPLTLSLNGSLPLPARGERAGVRGWSRIAAGGEAQAQRVEADEPFGVTLVVDRVLLEGDVGEAVEASRRLPADDTRRALVELHPHGALDILLALVDEGLQHRALRGEP